MDIAIIFLTPVMMVGLGLLIVRLRRLSWVEDVGMRLPEPRTGLLWLLAFLVLAIAMELVGNWFALDDPGGSWRGKYDAFNLAIRLLAIPLVYPLAEEFFFRGAFLGVLRRKFGDVVAILGSSLLFAVAHLQYDWRGMVFVLVDGLFFAICRVRTGSLLLVMLMHVLGNSYAAWERLYG